MLNRLISSRICKGKLEMFLQPQVNVLTGKIIGIELLVRWVNHLGKSIEPHFFLPLIRNSKYKAKFSQWVLEEAFRVSEALCIEGFNGRVACNLDASEMYSGIEFFLHKLRKEYPKAGEVEIEVTEVGHLSDRKNLEAYIECFKKHGIKVALDDFGTGLNNFDAVFNYDIDKVKTDKKFLNLNVEVREAFFSSICSITEKLGLDLVVEGIETTSELIALQELGVTTVQGFYISKPIPFKDFVSSHKNSLGIINEENIANCNS